MDQNNWRQWWRVLRELENEDSVRDRIEEEENGATDDLEPVHWLLLIYNALCKFRALLHATRWHSLQEKSFFSAVRSS